MRLASTKVGELSSCDTRILCVINGRDARATFAEVQTESPALAVLLPAARGRIFEVQANLGGRKTSGLPILLLAVFVHHDDFNLVLAGGKT